MFDWISLGVNDTVSRKLFELPFLNFETKRNEIGQPIPNKYGNLFYTCHYQGFKFVLTQYPNQGNRFACKIKGSFHKLWEGGSNYKDFTFQAFKFTVVSFCKSLNIETIDLVIHLIEFGVNITPPISSTELIEGIRTLGGFKAGREIFKGRGLMFDFDNFTDYRIKIYDKGRQYELDHEIFRFEAVAEKMHFILDKGVKITTMADLLTGDWNAKFCDLLIYQFERLIFCPINMVNPEKIKNPRSKRNFYEGMNPDYWVELHKTNPTKRLKQSDRFKQLFAELAPIDIHSVNKDLILKKWEYLSNAPEITQRGENNPYIYSDIYPFDILNQPKPRTCQSCGRDISAQKKGSKFCSERINGPQGKKCRNLDSNPRNNKKAAIERRKARQKRLYPSLTLFPALVHWDILAESPQNVSLTVPIIPLHPLNQTRIYDPRPIYNCYKPTL